jgi:hypothetical protein
MIRRKDRNADDLVAIGHSLGIEEGPVKVHEDVYETFVAAEGGWGLTENGAAVALLLPRRFRNRYSLAIHVMVRDRVRRHDKADNYAQALLRVRTHLRAPRVR